MYPFIYIQIHILEERFKQLQNHVDWDFSCNESLNRRLDTFRRKEAAEKEAVEKEAAEEEDDEEEDQQALPPGSSDDDGDISAIRFPRVSIG
jgi:type IV secretory pathway VirB9-like protein